MKNSQKVYPAKFQRSRGFALTLIVAILAILAIGAVLFVTKNEKVEAPVVDHSYKSSSYTQEEQTQARERASKVYTNTKYGFVLEFPDSWKDFVAQENTDEIKFCVKTQNPLSKDIPGYSCLYKIIITDRQTWEKEAAPCLGDRNSQAMCDWVDTIVGKNDKYVFSGTVAVQDYNDAEYLYIQETKKIIFKFINKVATSTPSVSTTTNNVACTMDAMMCPDGTYVGRSAPDCKFICPK